MSDTIEIPTDQFVDMRDQIERLTEQLAEANALITNAVFGHHVSQEDYDDLTKQLADLHKMLEQAFPVRVELGTVTAPEDCFAITVSDWNKHFTPIEPQEVRDES